MNYQKQMQLKRWNNQPIMVWLLLTIQILVFLAMTWTGWQQGMLLDGSTSGAILVQFGAMEKSFVIFNQEYWRFITPIFVHIGLMHLIINSITLYFIGSQLEALLGHWRFLLVYLLSGIAGNMLSFSFGAANSISAGASTALFGLLGLFVALGRIYRHNPSIQFMAQRMFTLIILNLLLNLFSSGIDMLGHLGGVIGGFLLGFIISVPALKGSGEKDIHRTIRAIMALVFFIGICFFYAYRQYGSFL